MVDLKQLSNFTKHRIIFEKCIGDIVYVADIDAVFVVPFYLALDFFLSIRHLKSINDKFFYSK